MKGQANILQHIITILLGTVVMISLIALAYTFYNISVRNQITDQLNQLSGQVRDNVIKLNELGKNTRGSPSNSSIIPIGELELSLPSNVVGKSYRILMISSNPGFSTITDFTIENQSVSPVLKTAGAKIIAETTESPIIITEQEVPNIDAGIQGRSENGVGTKLKYFRYNSNGTIYNKIVLGESDVLLEVTSIS